MKPGIPWSVKGIEAEAREAAKFAARRSGMTLGEWLNSMILERADGGDDLDRRYGHRRPAPGGRHGMGDADDLRMRLDALAEQLSSLNVRDQDTATSRYLARSIQDPEADPALKSVMRRLDNNEIHFTDAIDKVSERLDQLAGRLDEPREPVVDARVDDLLTRIDSNEQHTSQAVDRMGEELGNLARQVARLPEVKSFERPEDVPGFSSLETALRNVVDHIEVSDKRTRDTLRGLQERIAATQKAAETTRPAPDQTAALDRLERQLASLAERMESQEERGVKAVRALVDEKFSRLSEQVSTASHSADTLVARAETAAERQVREAEQRLKTMISEMTAKAARGDGGIEVGRLRADVEGLGRRLEAVKAEAASETEVRSLKSALEAVSGSIATAPDMAPFAEFEQRIEALSNELNARSGGSEMDNHLAALTQRIDELDGAVRAMAEPASGDGTEVASLKQHIAAVDERLSATERQLGHLEAIEKSIAQLFAAVEHNKSSSEEIAEATARRVADEMAARGGSPAGTSAETTSAIEALQQGLSAVKASAETADERNHETLEAVHETLEQIITKLAELESWHSGAAASVARNAADERSQPAPAGEDSLADIVEPDDAEDAATSWQSMMPDLGSDTGATAAEQGSHDDDDLFMPSLPPVMAAADDEQDAAVDGRTEPSLMAQQIDDDAQLTADETDDDAPPAHEDFIAAARRAAQSAAPRSALSSVGGFSLFSGKKSAKEKATKQEAAAASGAAGPKSRSRLSLPFMKRKAKDDMAAADNDATAKAAAATPPATPDEVAARRKRLILVGAVLLAAAALYGANAQRTGTPGAPAPQKVGVVTPPPSPSAIEPLVASTTVAESSDTPVTTALATSRQKPADDRSGMAPADALDQPVNVDTITTASIDPPNSDLPVTRSNDLGTSLNALANDQASRQPLDEAAGLPQTIGTEALRSAALAGNPNAQFVIASRYLEGKAVTVDAKQAARWYEKAAAQSLANAQYRLATLFERGLGVPQDQAAARMWYERAAKAGNVKAMHNLAVLLSDNTKGKADYPAAARWFAAAAAYGLKDSEFNLAVMNERGLGVTADRSAAFKLYSLAALQGDSDAAARAKTLRNYLSSAELTRLDAEVLAWKPKKFDRLANFVAIDNAAWNVEIAKPAPPLPPSPDLTGAQLISRAQELLGKLGFDVGSPDGVMGARTANAVRLFQVKNGLQVNGMVSNDLLRHLMAQTS